jgi:hypothetical protein
MRMIMYQPFSVNNQTRKIRFILNEEKEDINTKEYKIAVERRGIFLNTSAAGY